MRRWISLFVVAAMTGLAIAAAALAAPGKGAATPFKIAYGPVPGVPFHADCSGARIVNTNTGMIKDSETCLVSGDTSSLTAGTYVGDPYGWSPWLNRVARWESDFDYVSVATHWTVTLIPNADGTWTMQIVAYYN